MLSKLFSRKPKDLKAEVLRLPQTDETWEGSCFLARIWLHPRREASYRPYFFFLIGEYDIMAIDQFKKRPTNDRIYQSMLKAMYKPGRFAGPKRRPKRVGIDDRELVDYLKPRLAEVDVEVVYQEEFIYLPPASQDLEQSWQRKFPAPPSVLRIPGVSAALVGNIYTKAAEFYRLQPWRDLPYEVPIKVRVPAKASPRYVVVMGTAGENFGLSIHDQLRELYDLLSGQDPRKRKDQMTWLTLTYDTAPFLGFEDLDAIEQYQWPVENEQAYPSIIRFISLPVMIVPTKQDMIWLEGALPILIDYFEHHLALDEQGYVKPFEYNLTVETLNGSQKAYLGIPVSKSGHIRAESLS